MPLFDENNRPISSTPPPEEAPEKPTQNGHNHDNGVEDVRALPTGTLVYNLIKFTIEETGIGNALHAFEQEKTRQKMVADPPQIDRMREVLASYAQARYVVASELNYRFADIDENRRRELGIKVIVPSGDAAPTTD